jgi:EmrB/QacA subfamily drug resistance transporter
VTEVAVHASARDRPTLIWWTLAITSIALFVVTLDNLIVTAALPAIQRDFNASVQGLEWSVGAYTLTFAVFLLTAAALGERYGRRRVFVVGLVLFTAASAGCAVATNVELLDAARALQGMGAAIVTPLTLTILGDAFPSERRGLALGFWWGISGIVVGMGPLIGGVIVDGLDWRWIFWLNLPIGIAAVPLAFVGMRETRGAHTRLDVPGLLLASSGLFGIVWGLIRATEFAWTSQKVMPALGAGLLLTAAFVVWELAAPAPMLPLRFFRSRRFAAVNAVSLLASFGLFGSLFLLMQFLQVVQHDSALRAGLATLPSIGTTLLLAPLAAAVSVRLGARPFIALGLLLQAAALGWFAHVSAVDVGYVRLLPAFVAFGAGVALFLPAAASVAVGSARLDEAVPVSAANIAFSAVGGVLGVAGLTTILATYGSYGSGHAFTDGLIPALWVAAGVVGIGSLVSLLIPGRKRGVREVVATVVDVPARHPILAGEQPMAASAELPDLPQTRETETHPCPVCLGQGWFAFDPPKDPRTETCRRCYGHGTVLTGSHVPAHIVRDCPDCQGQGYVEARAAYETPQVRRAVPSVGPSESARE